MKRDEHEKKPWVLLTNDDGADSPALVPLLEELSAVVEVRAVVPASECSWTAKMVSRFVQLELDEIESKGDAYQAIQAATLVGGAALTLAGAGLLVWEMLRDPEQGGAPSSVAILPYGNQNGGGIAGTIRF